MSEDEEADYSQSSLPTAHSDDEAANSGARKRSRASEEPEEDADSSSSALQRPEGPLDVAPLRTAPPAPPTKKRRVAQGWGVAFDISS
jgi:hypothetical protein